MLVMAEIMTIEEFRELKRNQQEIIEKLDSNENKTEDDEDELLTTYLANQDYLISHDLSLIPKGEWKGFSFASSKDHRVDLSKTRANIDFSILDYREYINYKSCTISNLDQINRIIDSNNFDREVISQYKEFFLSDNFDENTKQKIYERSLTIEDLFSFSEEQINEIGNKKVLNCFNTKTRYMIRELGLEKTLQLYYVSKEDYQEVYDIINGYYYAYKPYYEENSHLTEELKNTPVQGIKTKIYSIIRELIIEIPQIKIELSKLTPGFIESNKDILLLDTEVPTELREKYYAKSLTLDDLLNSLNLFKNVPIASFIDTQEEDNNALKNIVQILGPGVFKILVESYPKQLNYIIKGKLGNSFYTLIKETMFSVINKTTDTNEGLKEYLTTFFRIHNTIRNKEQLLLYEPGLFELDSSQETVIKQLSLKNMQRFERETGFFSHYTSRVTNDLPMLHTFSIYLPNRDYMNFSDKEKKELTYEEFQDKLAELIGHIIRKRPYGIKVDFDWMEGEFREKHPEIFMDKNAPDQLKKAFYEYKITPQLIKDNPDYIPYLLDKNLANTINTVISLETTKDQEETYSNRYDLLNFIEEYSKRYGNEKTLHLIEKYGDLIANTKLTCSNKDLSDEKALEKVVRAGIYEKISHKSVNYISLLKDKDFVLEYPEIFIDFTTLDGISTAEKERLEKAFYKKELTYEDIKKHPSLKDALKNKDLHFIFSSYSPSNFSYYSSNCSDGDLELLNVFGPDKFLELCSRYGRYMNNISKELHKQITVINGKYMKFSAREEGTDGTLDFEDIARRIEEIIARECKNGNILYSPEDAPTFLKEKYSELFLNDDAPETLKSYFYASKGSSGLTFNVLSQHKEWIPYLKDKSLLTPFLRATNYKNEMTEYFNLFGNELAIKFGTTKSETVEEMIKSGQVIMMKAWYENTGCKFIPSFVVMQNFPLEEADKFLTSASNWSNLMRIKRYAKTPEASAAMLKLAYSFGSFDHDQRGYKKVYELLTGIPSSISKEHGYVVEKIDYRIKKYQDILIDKLKSNNQDPSQLPKEEFYQKLISEIKSDNCQYTTSIFDNQTLLRLISCLERENVALDFSKDIINQIYHKNQDESYSLIINPQNYPKTTEVIREILESFGELPILTPHKAHRLFGGFELKYDRDFREFFLENMTEIMENPDYATLLSGIQKQFSDIKRINSNRHLTLPLAVGYIQTNQYSSVLPGNEKLAEISSIAGYSQDDFEILQQIYNYGRQRTFSSIPRIENTTTKYSYEMLRLDDPLALAIGTLTDCCQELRNAAETCMEHSMVDKNGRVFVVRNEEGEIVAQSWVWRNNNVLCFDNIEIPEKALEKSRKESRKREFTDEIYEVYKQAARELIEKDQEVYKNLLETGKITLEEYESLKLGKVTVGLGYNDIAESIKRNSEFDSSLLTRPLPFQAPVKLRSGLYTSDSNTQYILEETEGRNEEEKETLPVHNDLYTLYDDSNFTEKSLITLEKLEMITKDDPLYLDTAMSSEIDSNHLVTGLARNYNLNPETTKVVMNPNFAIIYDTTSSQVRIGDLLFNTKIKTPDKEIDISDIVKIQIRLALDQISYDKEIVLSNLNQNQQQMLEKAKSLTDEIDKERGVSHAR